MSIVISSQFDAGNIECIDCSKAGDIRLRIRPDAGDVFFQWFYFRMTAPSQQRYSLVIENAGATSYPDGWDNYRVVASYDQKSWFRTDTSYVDGKLNFEIDTKSDVVWFAYFTPYSMERHQRQIARAAATPGVFIESLGSTLDGRSIDLVRIGNPDAALKIWAVIFTACSMITPCRVPYWNKPFFMWYPI